MMWVKHICKHFVILLCAYHWTAGHKISETSLEYPGDIKLGALFPIHKTGNPCGEIQREDGVQPLEAMLFSLDEVNDNNEILPGISLGVSAVDSCDNPLHAAEKAVPLLKGFITRKINLKCGNESNSYHIKRKRRSRRNAMTDNSWNCGDNIVGVIGPQTTAVTLKLANMGRVFRVPQVSYLATSPRLSDTAEFPFFFRTVPSDYHQANAIIELLNEFGWNYVSIVYSDSEYGETGFESIKKIIEKERDICLGESITIYNYHFRDKDYENIIQKLVMKKGESSLKPGVVIVFADRQPAGKLISAAKRLNKKDEFIWIGSDAWASRESVTEDREEFVEGAIAVQPLREKLPNFNAYLQDLIQSRSHHRKNNFTNPWFDEYLEAYYQEEKKNGSSNQEKFELGSSSKYQQLGYLHFVRDAVYAFAYAIHNLHADSCRNFKEDRLCQNFKQRVFVHLVDYIKNVTFIDVTNHTFQFTGIGRNDGPPRYSIVSFQKNGSIYDWQNVGTFYGKENGEGTKLHCEDDVFCDKFKDKKHFLYRKLKRCKRQECNVSEIKVPDSDDKCCWHCKPCLVDEYKATEFECMPCPEGQWSGGPENENGLSCVNKTETYLEYSDTYAIGTICVACAGVIMTVVATCIFAVHWNTPFIKASGRELSLILLAGIFLSFLTTFVFVTKPTPIVCGVMRFSIGICYTICYATVVIKTNRVARIFAIQFNEDSTSKSLAFKSKPIQNQPRFVSPLSSTLIVLFLISLEVIINVIWLIADPPKTMHFNDPINKASRVLVCSGLNESIMAGLIYPFFLILAATLYAFKTRKCRYVYFNETRFILFANTVTTIHWFVYVPLYLAFTNLAIRPVILSFSLSVSGIVQLCCLLFPKLYLVVFKPRKNTKATVMTTQRPRSQVAPDTPPNSVAVGVSDGPILLSRVYDRMNDANFSNYIGLPKHHSIAAQGVNMLEDQDEMLSPPGVGRRHPTWSHDLSVHERPRSRSMSITRSTQTNVNSKTISTPNGARHIIFNTGDDNEENPEECSNLAMIHHKGTGTDAGNGIYQQPNIKLSITDDEMEEFDQIIAQDMEEEDADKKVECKRIGLDEYIQSEPIEIKPSPSKRRSEQGTLNVKTGEVTMISKSC